MKTGFDYAVYLARCYSTEQREFQRALLYFLLRQPTNMLMRHQAG